MNDFIPLILRSLQGHSSQAEEDALQGWRSSSSNAEQEYQEYAKLLGLLLQREDSAEGRPIPSALALMHRAERRVAVRKWRSRMAWALGAAAVVVLAVGVSRFRNRLTLSSDPATEEFVTGANELATVRLKDGTVVRLGPQTQLRVIAWDRERQVSLLGRAFFAVAKQDGVPFRVRATEGDALVLGTRFELEASQAELRLLVVEGQVALTASRGPTRTVGAGKQVRILDGIALAPTRAANVDSTLGWIGQFLAFQSTPLREVASDIEQKYGVRVEVNDTALLHETITAWFVDRPLDEVVQSVCAALNAQCLHRGNTVFIDR